MSLAHTVKQEPDRSLNDRQRSESANPAVHYRDARTAENVAEDLSRPLSSSYPYYHRPSAHAGIVGAMSARLLEEVAQPIKLPPPAHSHHRRADAPSDHILPDGSSMRHRSPARNMPSPRAHTICEHLPTDIPPPRDDAPWPKRRTVPPPLPYVPPTPCTITTSTSGVVPKFSATSSGPPPLIHEPVKGAGTGSIVLGTPLSPEQRRRHFELPPAVGMLYKSGTDPSVVRAGFPGPPIAPPPPPAPPPQDGQFAIIARQSAGVPWPPSPMQQQPQSVIRAGGDANVPTSSRDLLYGDMMTARQMHRNQVAALTDSGSTDRRRISPRSAGSYGPPSWPRTSAWTELTGQPYFDDMHRADILNTMLPWPVRPPANVMRYSVCGEPSRQCYTPPLPIHKAFVGRDAAVSAGTFPSSDRLVRGGHDRADALVPSRGIPDTSRGGDARISPRYRDAAEHIAEWRRGDLRRSPAADPRELPPETGGHRPPDHIQAPAVTSSSDQMTAANLIDAIIIDQINQEPGPDLPAKPCAQSPSQAAAAAVAAAVAASSVNAVIRLRTDTSTSDQCAAGSGLSPVLRSPDKQQRRSPADTDHSGQKDLTLGEHIHSIIMDDFKPKDGDDADGSAFDTATNNGKIYCLNGEIQLWSLKNVISAVL